jgi:CRISPR/Cas system-associated protein Cas7 (RAMP superfamily)
MTREFLTTNALAAALGIGRESARLLMKRTRGVIVLPLLNGVGQRQTRRMPRAVLESLLVTRRNKPV